MSNSIAEKIILEMIKRPPQDSEGVNTIRRRVLRETTDLKTIPTNADLIRVFREMIKRGAITDKQGIIKLLTKRAVRTLSGVAIITVLTKPFPCPGKCVYCPSEKGMPKSYLSDEPAANRAWRLKFDPFEQVRQRILALEANGHPTDKIELIVKGGTWSAYTIDYQYWFIGRCFEAANSRRNSKFETLNSKLEIRNAKTRNINNRISNFEFRISNTHQQSRSLLLVEQKHNETAKHRIVGLTLETRPDFINEKNIKIMRELGCTRVELGVQTIDDKILKTIKRGHDSGCVATATELLKNYGFKVDYHLMPQLPGSTPRKDLIMMQEIFTNPAYRPDMIKIYPCTVIKNSELYSWLLAGKYEPYSDSKLITILKKFKCSVPRYVRISRLIRDIPGNHIEAGNKMTNLRQVIQSEMAAEGTRCGCLRCREIGHNKNFESQMTKFGNNVPPEGGIPPSGGRNNDGNCEIRNLPAGKAGSKFGMKMFVEKYEASGGVEYFLSFEDETREAVFAFCRLRLPLTVTKENCLAFIRELHTYGQLKEIDQKSIKPCWQAGMSTKSIQHTGFGKKLMAAAEKICQDNKIKKIAVISGVGVRGYYRKLGYRLENGYMMKSVL